MQRIFFNVWPTPFHICGSILFGGGHSRSVPRFELEIANRYREIHDEKQNGRYGMEARTEPEDNGRLQTLKQFKNVNGSVIIDVKS